MRGFRSSTLTAPAAIRRIASGRARARPRGSPSRAARGRESYGTVDRALQDDRPGVDALVDEVDGDPGDLDAVLERLPDRVEARERRQQRRVDVDDPVRGSARTNSGDEQLHVAGEHDEVRRRARSSQSAIAASRVARSPWSSRGEDAPSRPRRSRRAPAPAPRLVGGRPRRPRSRRGRAASRIACRLVPVPEARTAMRNVPIRSFPSREGGEASRTRRPGSPEPRSHPGPADRRSPPAPAPTRPAGPAFHLDSLNPARSAAMSPGKIWK